MIDFPFYLNVCECWRLPKRYSLFLSCCISTSKRPLYLILAMSLYSILYCSIPCWWQRLNPADEKPAKYIPCTQVRNLQKDTTLHILSTLLILYDRHWTAPIRQFHLSISLLTWFTNSKIIIILQQSIYYCPLSRSFSLSHIHARSHYHKLLNNVCILKCPDNVNHSKKSSKKQTSHYCPFLHNADAAAPPPPPPQKQDGVWVLLCSTDLMQACHLSCSHSKC